MSEENTEGWFVVYTRPRSEKRLAEALAKKGIEYYLPVLKIRKKWTDRIKWLAKPAFDSYIFVKIAMPRDRLKILMIPHAVNFVHLGNYVAEISQADIELLRIAIDNFSESIIVRNSSALEAGQKVKIKAGPFAGKEATISRISGKTVVWVSFPSLNKAIEVEIPVEYLESQADKLLGL